MLISNNRPSFHLWGKKNLVKHQKVSKYYENDCSLKVNSVSKLDLRYYQKIRFLVKVLRNSMNVYVPEVILLINNCLEKGVFPNDLKHLYSKRKIYNIY